MTGTDTFFALVAGVATFGALLSFFFFLAGRWRRHPDPVISRLSPYDIGLVSAGPSETVESGASKGRFAIREGMVNAISSLMSRTSHAGKLATDLQKADLKIKPSEWVLIVLVAAALLAVFTAARFDSWIFLLIVPPIIWFSSGFYLRFRQSKRKRAFEAQLGDTIVLLSNALKAGLSFAQAMETVSRNAQPPISEDFHRANREIALGVNPTDALSHLVERNNSEDLDLLVTAVQIQRVVGGNLAEILDTIAFTIRERVRIQGEIRTLTAQARTSGWIISILPVALAIILAFISPGYFGPMLSETAGHLMLVAGGVMIITGFAIMSRIAKIEV